MRVPVALAFAGFVLIGLGGGAGGVLLPAQIADYHVDKSRIGLLFFAFSAGYVVAGAANGWLLRRFGLRGTVVTGTAVFAVSTFAAGLQPLFSLLLLVTVVFGAGSGVIDAALNAYLAGLPRHTALLNLLHAFYGVGAFLGPLLAGAMLTRGLSWGAVYLVFAASAVPLVVAFALWYPRDLPPDGPDAANAAGVAAGALDTPGGPGTAASALDAPSGTAGTAVATPVLVRSVFGSALRHPAVLLCALFLAVYAGVEVSLGNWAFSFLVEERGQGALLAAWVTSGYWLGFTLGRFVLSALAQRFGVGPVELTFGCLGVVAASTLLTWFVPGTIAAAVGFVLVGAALGPIFPLTIAVLPRLAPGALVPTAIGLLVGVSVIGAAFFPWLAGTIAQRVGLDSLLPFTVLLTVALLGNWWRIARLPVRTPER